MKLLFSSPDLAVVGSLVKRLIGSRIPCAVFKDPVNYAYLRVWVQQDTDFAPALNLLLPRTADRPSPPLGAIGCPEECSLGAVLHSP